MLNNILIINGANLNLLGDREKSIYGSETLKDLETIMLKEAKNFNINLDFFQSNIEGDIINKIHFAYKNNINYIIINPGGYSHTSISILDSILATNHKITFIEVHISNIHKRDDFRNTSIISKGVTGVISGLGFFSYLSALYFIHKNIIAIK
jgi:3-dehydroquinate dehydratase-2